MKSIASSAQFCRIWDANLFNTLRSIIGLDAQGLSNLQSWTLVPIAQHRRVKMTKEKVLDRSRSI